MIESWVLTGSFILAGCVVLLVIKVAALFRALELKQRAIDNLQGVLRGYRIEHEKDVKRREEYEAFLSQSASPGTAHYLQALRDEKKRTVEAAYRRPGDGQPDRRRTFGAGRNPGDAPGGPGEVRE